MYLAVRLSWKHPEVWIFDGYANSYPNFSWVQSWRLGLSIDLLHGRLQGPRE